MTLFAAETRKFAKTPVQMHIPCIFRHSILALSVFGLILFTTASLHAEENEAAPNPKNWEERSADTLLNTIQSETSRPIDRLTAVRTLLYADETTLQALAELIQSTNDNNTLLIVADAISRHPASLDATLGQALLKRANVDSSETRLAIADALSQFLSQELQAQLESIAKDAEQPTPLRQTCILALSHDRTTSTAQLLLSLLDDSDPTIARTANEALSRMVGVNPNQQTPALWQSWWETNRDISQHRWQQMLTESLGENLINDQRRLDQVQRRLVETNRRLYLMAEPSNRSQMLADFLQDDLESIRSLGLTLALQRFLDSQTLDDSVVQAIRNRLFDPSSALRARAVLLLRDMNDSVGARWAAGQFETMPNDAPVALVNAYLKLFARQPQPQTIERIIACLPSSETRTDAVQALASAAEADILGEDQRQRLATVVRRLAQDNRVSPELVVLTAAVGDTQDWQWVEQWLAHDEPEIRRTAARMWHESQKPVPPLLPLLSDPVVEPLVLRSIQRRGQTSETLNVLLAHVPSNADRAADREQALIALASRVDKTSAYEAAKQLAKDPEQRQVALRFISEAVNNVNNGEAPTPTIIDPAKLQLLFIRAELRLDNNELSNALSDINRIQHLANQLDDETRASLDTQLTESLALLSIRQNWLAGETRQATEHAQTLFTRDEPGTPERLAIEQALAQVALQATKQLIQLNKLEQADSTIQALERWMALDDEQTYAISQETSDTLKEALALIKKTLQARQQEAEQTPAPEPDAPIENAASANGNG